jgi:hypothetical protein
LRKLQEHQAVDRLNRATTTKHRDEYTMTMSTPGLFLTHEELTELTGFKTPSGHARWLDKNRWRYVLTRSQQARVSRDYFLERMGSTKTRTGAATMDNHAAAMVQPDFAAMGRR